jgi:glycosyltransferase involved in cell wall biosynthesis
MPTYEKPAYLDLTLASYVDQARDAHEIVVIDDGETGAAAQVVAKYQDCLPPRFLHPGHGGRARARNHGLAGARGEIAIFADEDCIVGRDVMRRHSKATTRGRRGSSALEMRSPNAQVSRLSTNHWTISKNWRNARCVLALARIGGPGRMQPRAEALSKGC